MNKIISKEHFSDKVVKLVVEAPLIAKSRRAGHFVIVRCGEHGERIPLTIAQADTKNGTITLVVQSVGVSTQKICALEPGDYLTDVVGPLGQATQIKKSPSRLNLLCKVLLQMGFTLTYYVTIIAVSSYLTFSPLPKI